jgi:hypothetical protein
MDSWVHRGAAQQVADLKKRERYALESQLLQKCILLDPLPAELQYLRAHYVAMVLLERHEKVVNQSKSARLEDIEFNHSTNFYRHLISAHEFRLTVSNFDRLLAGRPLYSWIKKVEETPLGSLEIFERIEAYVVQVTKQVQRFLSCGCLEIKKADLSFHCIYDGLIQMWGFPWLNTIDDSNHLPGRRGFISRKDRLRWLSTQPESSRKNMEVLLDNLSQAFGQLGDLSSVIKRSGLGRLPEPLRIEYDCFLRSRYRYWFVGLLMFDHDLFGNVTTGFMRLSQWISGKPLGRKELSSDPTSVELRMKRRCQRWRARGKAYLNWIRRASVELDRPATYEDFVAAGDFSRQDGWEREGRRIYLALDGKALP